MRLVIYSRKTSGFMGFRVKVFEKVENHLLNGQDITHMTSNTFLMLVGPVVKLYVPLDGLVYLYHSGELHK